jgi:uncharacterized protein (TIGR02598 family)
MTRFQRRRAGFSLVEVTLALGVAGFCLLAVFALLPMGVQTNQTAFSQTAATTILSDVAADMRAAGVAATTTQYGITFGTTKAICFDSQGGFTDCTTAPPQSTARYRALITFPTLSQNPTYATCANIKITWPAIVDPTKTGATPAGSIETVAAFDRQ